MNVSISAMALFILVSMVIVAALAWSKLKKPGAGSLVIMAAAIGLWAIVYLVNENYTDLSGEPSLALGLVYLAMLVAVSALFTFSLAYSNHLVWRSRPVILLLCVLPLLTQILFWIEPVHQLFFHHGNNSASLLPLEGPWSRVTAIYTFSLAGASVLMLFDIFSRKPRPLLRQSWPIAVGSALVFLNQLLVLIGIRLPLLIDPALLAFALAGGGFAYGLFNRKMIESIPLTRDMVVQGLTEGWMVLDARNIIVDLNPSAERMIGVSREKAYGQPINSVLGDISNLGSTFDEVQELEMKRSFKSQEGEWRYFNIRISPLSDLQKEHFGRLVVLRDITERRLAEDARQRARDEMFVLLNAISSEASQAENLEEFLTQSILQIIFPFHSQVVAIFIADDKRELEEEPRFYLNSHFGLAQEAVDSMPYISYVSPMLGPALKEHHHLVMNEPADQEQIPASLRYSGCACLLMMPLTTSAGEDSKTVGCMWIGRKEKPGYSQDEIARISAICEHLANLISNDRRKKLAIALSERQKLMRDLHDSVSQKLYGLVMQTEAAQVGLEAGSRVDTGQLLSRIGDQARQAVKEMRLFLYQMQPVELEKEGLISVLHHRLSAVEGRADMKARLLADEDISLSMEKEVALYYIAQEALNNVLKHARAKNVLVKLKQGRKNVILEVLDDGCGFDSRSVDRAGLGLTSMTERAAKVKAKLKIQSKPEEGTKIVVTVAKDQPLGPPRHRR